MKHLAIPRGIYTPNLEFLPQKLIDVMPILETWSEVNVTVTGKWNRTIRHSKMYLHSKFGISTSNHKRDMLQI